VSSSDPWVAKLTIETPEQTSLEYPLAGVGSRFLALALDTLIQYGVGILLFMIFAIILPVGEVFRGAFNWAAAILILCLFLLMFGYYAIFEAIWNGQTPGKRVARLRVIQDSGRPLTVYQAILRNLVRTVDYLPSMYVVGILCAFISRQHKRLGDFAAGTVVVHERPIEHVAMAAVAPNAAAAPAYGIGRLSAEELQLIESFLQRRSYLAADVRANMARQIANHFAARLPSAGTERQADEPFLEALAREGRATAGYR
jgi:uncharacterized RDD family membrane protein YckC